MSFAVVIKVPPPESAGNMATSLENVYVKTADPKTFEDDEKVYTAFHKMPGANPMMALALHAPVFHVGEILILDPDGREPGYPGRKPGKWSVEIEHYSDVGEAIKRAREVMRVP